MVDPNPRLLDSVGKNIERSAYESNRYFGNKFTRYTNEKITKKNHPLYVCIHIVIYSNRLSFRNGIKHKRMLLRLSICNILHYALCEMQKKGENIV